MKVLQHTSEKLTFRIRPWFAWFVGGFFLTGGILPTFLSSQQTLTCDRTPPNVCELTSKSLWRESYQIIPLETLQRAELESRRDSDGDTLYQVILQTQSDRLPLIPRYQSGYEQHQRYVDQINTFLATPQQSSLQIHYSDRILSLVALILVGGAGLLTLILFGQIIIYDFDKQSGQFQLTQKGLTGTKHIQQTLALITDTRLDRHRGSKGGWNYRVSLILKSGEAIALTPYYSSGRADKEKTIELIHRFLPLPADH